MIPRIHQHHVDHGGLVDHQEITYERILPHSCGSHLSWEPSAGLTSIFYSGLSTSGLLGRVTVSTLTMVKIKSGQIGSIPHSEEGRTCLRSSPNMPEIIQRAIWLYLRFTLSFRDVEDLMAERGIMVSKPLS